MATAASGGSWRSAANNPSPSNSRANVVGPTELAWCTRCPSAAPRYCPSKLVGTMPCAAAATALAVGPNTALAPRTAPLLIDAASAPKRSLRVGVVVAAGVGTGGSGGAACSWSMDDVSAADRKSTASKKRSLVLLSACSSGLSPPCWFMSAALPDFVPRSGLLRRPDGLGARRDNAGFPAGVGAVLCCCGGAMSITTSVSVGRGGWEALAEGVFITACPRFGGKGGVLPPGLRGC